MSNTTSSCSWVPNKRIKWQLDIDIVGTCNLACPSCPVGNLSEKKTVEKYMRPDMLDRIITKAKSESRVVVVYLYNWTEPFLHPNLAEMIKIVHAHGIPCGLSSNLNIISNIDEVMEANPFKLKVSLSGFNQKVYGKTHRLGDIELVKQNMVEVALAKKRAGSSTQLVVGYHRYLGNHEDESAMNEYARSLGYEMEPAWAYFMPLEKMLAYVGSGTTDVTVSEEDQQIIDSLALPLPKAVEVAKRAPQQPCALRARQMSITASGDVTLCCSTFDQSKYKIGQYLDTPLDELQDIRYRHNTCETCMNNGLHVLFMMNDEKFEDIALANVARHYPDSKLERIKPARVEPPRGIKAGPDKIKREARRLLEQVGVIPDQYGTTLKTRAQRLFKRPNWSP